MNKQIRLIIILSLILPGLLFSAAAAAQAVSTTVQVPTLTAAAGGSVDVPIEASGAQGIGAMHIELVYDPAVLAWESVSAGTMAESSLIDAGADNPGRLVVSLATLNSLQGDGPIAVARFKVTGASGQETPLTLENTTAWEGETYREIQVILQSGKLTIGGGFPSLWIIALVALCLIAILGILAIFFFVRMSRRQRQPAPVAYPAGPQYPPPPPASQQPVRPAGQTIYCTNCGTPNTAGARFCQNCGSALGGR